MSKDRYDRVKHLVEVEDDILAVFTVTAKKENGFENLWIAKNAKITRDLVDNVFVGLQRIGTIRVDADRKKIVGNLKWTIHESNDIRTLIIYEKDRDVVALIKSNKSLSETADNILGYYYEDL